LIPSLTTGITKMKSAFYNNQSQKYKVGIVVDQLLAGGVQKAAIEQVKLLNQKGHKAKLLILMRKKYQTDFSYLVKDVPHQYLSDSFPPLFRKTLKFPIFNFLSTSHLLSPFLAPKVINKADFDILISWGTTTCLTTQAIFNKLGIPYIAIIHDPIVYILDKVYPQTTLKYFLPLLKPIAKHFEKSFVDDALKTLVISKVHRQYIKENYHTTATVVHLGVGAQKQLPKKLGNAILSFGRWQKEKNPRLLLKILKRIPKAQLIIAGTWIYEEDLKWFKNLINDYHLQNRVQLITNYTNSHLVKIASKSRVFVHPHFEAFGLAALEAASLALPIIVPYKSGVTEKFVHGKHGLFPRTITENSYSKYIKKLLSDRLLAEQMGQRAAHLVAQKYTWEENVNTLVSIIAKQLKATDKPEMLVIEIGHSLGTALGGGDLLMQPMAENLNHKYNFTILTTQIGKKHWLKSHFNPNLRILPNNPFDNKGDPFPVFLTYCIRMVQAFTKLLFHLKKSVLQNENYIYSSTNVLPDILPAFLIRKIYSNTTWIARIHHLIPPPHKREGDVFVNLISFLMQIIALRLAKKADLIIALNSNLLKELINRGFSEKKLSTLGAGVDYEKILKYSDSSKQTLYKGIFIGRLHRTKGVLDLPNIWKHVVSTGHNTAKLAIIGELSDPKVVSQLKSKINKLGLSKNIDILGFVTENEKYSILKRASVFLFTDHEAGWGLAVAEAFACGVPVIGYDIGILETIYKTGFLTVPLGKHKQFADQVNYLLKNSRKRNSLGKLAQKEVSNYKWKSITNRFDKMLKS